MDTVTQVKILNEAICISYYVTILEKGMYPSTLFSVIGE